MIVINNNRDDSNIDRKSFPVEGERIGVRRNYLVLHSASTITATKIFPVIYRMIDDTEQVVFWISLAVGSESFERGRGSISCVRFGLWLYGDHHLVATIHDSLLLRIPHLIENSALFQSSASNQLHFFSSDRRSDHSLTHVDHSELLVSNRFEIIRRL